MEHLSVVGALAAVFGISFVSGSILRAIKAPEIIGYMVAGIVVGPHVLGLVSDGETVRTLAELAVLLLMFMIGLELDISLFKKYMRPAMIVTVGNFLLTACIMTICTYLFAWSWGLVIVASCIMTLSSTAIAINLLRDAELTNSDSRVRVIAMLIAQDVLVVPMLLVIGMFGEGFVLRDAFSLLTACGVIVLVMFLVFELVSHPHLVDRIEKTLLVGATNSAISGLALCFAAAALSALIGLSAAFGAFVVGLIIGNVGTVGANYRTQVAPIHDVLVMIFFISLGLLFDIQFVLTHITGIAMALVAVTILKIGGTFFPLVWLGETRSEALTLSTTLAHIGEFGFVIGSTAVASSLITTDQYQFIITIIAVSLLLAPLWTQGASIINRGLLTQRVKNPLPQQGA
ncbi:MAG: NEM-activable antiporter [Candidatus Parcubacteria bacterium]|jgi:CPA2 family monovalent cation:H+ antiporter-2